MDRDALAALACPHCGGALSLAESALRCGSGHNFDIARHGYVSLLGSRSRTDTSDSAPMVDARARFTEAGHYQVVARAASNILATSLPEDAPGPIADIGAGTGWLLARLLDGLPGRSGVAIDSSKYATRRSAVAHPRIVSVVADAWSVLPLADGACSAVVSFFAPRNVPEFRRILHDRGCCLVISPGSRHLRELRDALGLVSVETAKDERIERSFKELFEGSAPHAVEAVMALDRPAVLDLARMGPSAHHTTAERLEKAVAGLPEVTSVTLSVTIREFRPVSG